MGINWIKVFNIDAHHRSSIPEQTITVKRVLEGNNTGLDEVKDIAISTDTIYVLNQNRVLAFPRNFSSNDITPTVILNDCGEGANSLELIGDKLIIKFANETQKIISI